MVLKLANHLWSTGMHRKTAASGQEALFDHLKKGHSAVLVGQVGQDQRNGEAQRNGKNWGNVAALDHWSRLKCSNIEKGSQMVPFFLGDEWLSHWESEIVLALDRFLGCGNELKELQIISLERLQNPKGWNHQPANCTIKQCKRTSLPCKSVCLCLKQGNLPLFLAWKIWKAATSALVQKNAVVNPPMITITTLFPYGACMACKP